MRSPITLNAWQRKAQERWPHGIFHTEGVKVAEWLPIKDPVHIVYDDDNQSWPALSLPTILEHLAYERQECERCEGAKTIAPMLSCVDCRDESGKPTGLDPDYRKAQEWAERLGLGDG